MDYETVKNLIILFFLILLGIILLNANNRGNPFEISIKIILSQIDFFLKKPKEHIKIIFPYFIVWLISSEYFYFPKVVLIPLILLTGIFLVVSIHRLVIIEDKNFFWLNLKKIRAFFSYIIYGFLFLILLFIPLIFISLAFQNIIYSEGVTYYLYILLLFGSFFFLAIIFSSYALNLPKAAIGEKVEFFKMYYNAKGYKIIILIQFILITSIYRIIDYLIPFLTNNIYSILIFSSIMAAFSYSLLISCISKTFLLMHDSNKI